MKRKIAAVWVGSALMALVSCAPKDYSKDGSAGNNSTVTGLPDSANAGAVYLDTAKKRTDTVTNRSNRTDTAVAPAH